MIDLRIDNIENSSILLNAKHKEQIDYNVALELSTKNKEFSNFLKSIVDFDPKNQHRFEKEFDFIKTKEELEVSITKSQMI